MIANAGADCVHCSAVLLCGRLLAPVPAIEEDREIEPRLMVAGIGRDLSHKLGGIADGGGLFGEGERRWRQ